MTQTPSQGDLTFLTVVHLGEIPSLKLQARSLARFADSECVANILICLNDWRKAEVRRAVEDLLDDYGPLKQKVRILDASDVFAWHPRTWSLRIWRNLAKSALTYRSRRREFTGWFGFRGWKTQQAFKLAAAKFATGEHVVILDAKNFFLSQVNTGDFVDANNRSLSTMRVLDDLHKKWLTHSISALGYSAETLLEAPVPQGMTPFIVDRALLMDTLDTVEREIGPVQVIFPTFKRMKITEFMLIVAQCHVKHGSVNARFSRGLMDRHSTYRSWDGQRITALLEGVNDGWKIIGIHRSSWPKFDQHDKVLFKKHLLDRQLIFAGVDDAFLDALYAQGVD